jgi:hypothetical protein
VETTRVTGGGVLRRNVWRVPIWVATALFGGWVADLYVPGFHIDGSLTLRLVVGGVIAGLSAVAAVGAMLALFVPLSGFMMIGGTRRMGERGPELVPHPVGKAVGAVILFLVTLVVVPVAAFLAVRACEVVGLPVELTGGWQVYFTFGLVLAGVRACAQALLAPRIRNRRVRPWVAGRLAFVACVAVLWLAVELTGAVRLDPPSGRLLLVDVLVLAAMLDTLRFTVGERWGMVAQAPFDVVAMGVLAWSSGQLVTHLEFSGPWALVLTAVVLTAVTMPLRLLSPPTSRVDEVGNRRRVGSAA